jgi:hypothetical protein
MKFISFALLAIACMSAFSVATILLFMHHGARDTKLAKAGDDIRADLEQLKNETNRRIEKLENEISTLKAEFAVATPSLVDFSIVPTIKGSLDSDSEVQNEKALDAAPSPNSDVLIEKAFSEIAKAFGPLQKF